jgi:HEPN domain-containing protein
MSIIHQNPGSEWGASAAPAERILLWLRWADKDYVAARRLLLNAYLPQGAALGNTALEKYFKTLFMILGKKVPRSHNVVALHEGLLKHFPNLEEVTVNFLKVLCKAYRLRYPDNLEVEFSVSLGQPKILTELDRTVHHIRRGFSFSKLSGKPITTLIDPMIKRNDPDLVDANCYFSSAQRSDVFHKLTNCYEMRVVALDRILEAYYEASIPDDGDFPLEGLRRPAPTIPFA